MQRLYRIEAFVYENTEANKLFHQYLKQQHSTEGLDFLNMIKELRAAFKQIDHGERMEVIQCLLTTFLKKESPLINISFELHRSIWQQWNKLSGENDLSLEHFNELISPVEKCVLVQLKLDIFPSFCHAPILKAHLASKSKDSRQVFLNKVTYAPQKKHYFDYNYTSLFESEITDQDFAFGKQLSEEQAFSQWKSISTNSSVANHSKLSSEIIDCKHLSLVKWEGNLECDLHNAGTILHSFSDIEQTVGKLGGKNFLAALESSTTGKSASENTKFHLLLQFNSKWLRQRQTCSTIQWKHFKDPECIIGICKSLHPTSTYFTNRAYGLRHFTVIYLNPSTRIGETKYTVISLYDAQGFLRGNVRMPWVKNLIIKCGIEFHTMMRKFVNTANSMSFSAIRTPRRYSATTPRSKRHSEGEIILQSLKS